MPGEAGFEPDYLDAHTDFSWERVRNYNCLVLYGCPAAGDEKSWGFPRNGPRRQDYIDTVERFLAEGGGVFMMVDTHNADQDVKPLIERWGARLPYETYVEQDPGKMAPLPRMRGHEMLSLVDQVLPSPISDGVENLWLPYGERYSGSWSAPIAVSADWQVVVKGSRTSHSQPVDHAASSHAFPPPPDALVRPGGVPAPDLMAIRSYGKGRLALLCQGPVWSIGQGTRWLYNRRVLSRGLNDIPSDFERLTANAFRWLSAPSLESGALGGHETDPQRFVAPNLRPGVKAEFERTFWSDEELDLHRPSKTGKLYRGLIGARTSLTGGGGSVESYAEAAREAGLHDARLQFRRQGLRGPLSRPDRCASRRHRASGRVRQRRRVHRSHAANWSGGTQVHLARCSQQPDRRVTDGHAETGHGCPRPGLPAPAGNGCRGSVL